MCRPCDTGICDPFSCSKYDECLSDTLFEPSAGSIPQSIPQTQEDQRPNVNPSNKKELHHGY
jgi:hypothetical protein